MPAALASVIVFVTSGAVLVLEILAGRLLAPYVGVTLETFTGIIGVVLAGMALGTWLGGWAADRTEPRRWLGSTLAIGGILAIFSVPLVRWFGSAVGGNGPVEIVVLATVGFFLPSAVLSAASPLVVKIQLTDLGMTGHVVGRLSAMGTIGSLVGVFVTGFVFVAAFPTTPVILAVGGALVIGGAVLHVYLDAGRPRPAVVVGGLALVAGAGALAIVTPDRCDVETAYFCASVREDPDRASGRFLVLDTLNHSYVDLDDPTELRFGYVRTFGDLVDAHAPGPVTAVHVGGGGFTLPRYVHHVRPGSENLVLELDPALVDLASEELGLVLGDGLSARTGDARNHLRSVPDASADFVFGDAFGGVAVPWHLTTVEVVRDMDRVLTDDGIYAINVIDAPPYGFLRAELATMREVFPYVATVGIEGRVSDPMSAGSGTSAARDRGGNVVVLGSRSPLPVEALRAAIAARGGPEAVVDDPAVLDRFIGGARVLTDDHAPVDQLLTPPR